MRLAVQDQNWMVNSGDPGPALDMAQTLGARSVRVNAYRGQSLAKVLRAVDAAHDRGLGVHVTLTGRPGARPSARRFAQWAGREAHTLSKHGVNTYSVWNEPNLPAWNPQGARWYGKAFERSYKSIHRNAPHSTVLFGETAPEHTVSFVRKVTKGRHITADGFAHHPYQQSDAPSVDPGGDFVGIGSLKRYNRELGRLANQHRLQTRGGKRLPVWITEFGYARDTHPDWVDDAYRAAKRAHARQFFQYQLAPAGQAWDTSVQGTKAQRQLETLFKRR